MLKIISTTATSEQQLKKDRPELEKKHALAMKNDPMWAFFGGTLTVNGREYQVMMGK